MVAGTVADLETSEVPSETAHVPPSEEVGEEINHIIRHHGILTRMQEAQRICFLRQMPEWTPAQFIPQSHVLHGRHHITHSFPVPTAASLFLMQHVIAEHAHQELSLGRELDEQMLVVNRMNTVQSSSSTL
ncbi:hypothetical protein H920_16978 [Fukomys damarensis]|uniref:Uncharacterized protein n=1 Tax=Fukomys damarensis TaxID=885580 RepID=A0A091DFS8_FUKDA|nr:hypothetical protein H920_16978 [Fukomys damarensis]